MSQGLGPEEMEAWNGQFPWCVREARERTTRTFSELAQRPSGNPGRFETAYTEARADTTLNTTDCMASPGKFFVSKPFINRNRENIIFQGREIAGNLRRWRWPLAASPRRVAGFLLPPPRSSENSGNLHGVSQGERESLISSPFLNCHFTITSKNI